MTKKVNDIININSQFLINFQIATFQNAKRLLLESESLFKLKMFPTSTFLAFTAIEEMGKFYLLRTILIKNSNNKLTLEELKKLRAHSLKQLNSFLPPFPFNPEKQKTSKNIRLFWRLHAEKKLMTIRNNCLYTDFDIKNLSSYTPCSSIKEKDARYFLEVAFEVMLLQTDSLLSCLDCTREHLFLNDERILLKNRYEAFIKSQ